MLERILTMAAPMLPLAEEIAAVRMLAWTLET